VKFSDRINKTDVVAAMEVYDSICKVQIIWKILFLMKENLHEKKDNG